MPSLRSRKTWLLCFFLALNSCLPAAAQYRGSSAQRKTNPRAVAVLQVLPTGKARLLPVSIFLDGKFYDARYYMAKPVPLALYDETVYEALPDGMPAGEFTVHTARILPNVIWGDGDWKPLGSGSAGVGDAKAEAKGQPVSTVTFPGTVKETKEERKADKREEKERKKQKPEPRPASTTPPPTAPPNNDNDPDRPVFKKGGTTPQVKLEASDITPKQPKDDSDRPMLSRAKAKEQEEPETITPPSTDIPGTKYLVAVSDPDPMENRPFQFNWSEAEKAKYQQQLTKLAMQELRKFAASGQTRAPLPTNAQFADVQLRALDLDYSNSPYMVFTGRVDPTVQAPATATTQGAPAQLATFYVTLVVRVGSLGELNRLLTVATDSLHLDLAPRLEFIDAVDADGDNRADLLFRKRTDAGSSFVLYRLTPFQMTQIFEGGAAL